MDDIVAADNMALLTIAGMSETRIQDLRTALSFLQAPPASGGADGTKEETAHEE